MTNPLTLEYEGPAACGGLNGSKGWVSTIGWAIYLGMSWTWCIGMFLPVLLVRDFGVWGWIAFAVPNVIGAAAMGWTITSAAQSRAMVDAHRPLMATFSFVTTAFQIFFAMWFFERLGLPIDWPKAVIAAALLLVLVPTLRNPSVARWIAFIVLIISCVCVLGACHTGELYRIRRLSRPDMSISGLTSACLIGFGLCPYLDLTFHHARQQVGRRDSRIAFSVGFGGFFFGMILFSLAYASALLMTLMQDVWNWSSVLTWVCVHIAAQLALTIGLHWREVAATGKWHRDQWFLVIVGSTMLGILAAVYSRRMSLGGFEPGELIYRYFMGFYGLIFPAYVWICMVPNWRSPVPPTRRMWVVCAITVITAAPFYWAGFIENRMIWVVPGVVIVLLARAFVPWKLRAVIAYN